MKLLKNIFPFVLLLFALQSCVDNDPEIEDFPGDRVAFTYAVQGDYKEDFYIGSEIKFDNISEAGGACHWDFGDGTTSDEPSPIHKFRDAATYKVTLTITGEGSTTRNLLISDIFPTVTVDEIPGDEGICEVKNTPVHLSVYLPNPENLAIEYNWAFPEGTTDVDGNVMTTFDGADPGQIKFNNVGSQKIVLKTKMGGRSLEEGIVNVQVGYNQPVKTIYYAIKNGNLMARKLVDNAPTDVKIFPFDLGLKSGQHPLNILCDDSLVYVLDPGKQFTYVDDVDSNLGDGQITVVSRDGKIVETLISNAGSKAFDDPFYGYIDKNSKVLYLSDRNTGIAKINTKDRNLKLDREKYPFWVQNDRLDYYNVGWQYGAMNACFTRSGDIWYWSKTYNGLGVFRFKESDIKTEAVKAGQVDKPYKVLFNGLYIKSFVIDDVNKKAYFVVRASGTDGGLYATSLATFDTLFGFSELSSAVASGTCTKVASLISDDDGSSGEFVDVSQMVLDPADGTVYFGYRASSASTLKSGLYKYTPTGNKLDCLVPDVEIYGVTINNTKSKLF